MAPVLKILGVPRLPPGGSLGTGKRGTVPKIWRGVLIFLARVNGVLIVLAIGSAIRKKERSGPEAFFSAGHYKNYSANGNRA